MHKFNDPNSPGMTIFIFTGHYIRYPTYETLLANDVFYHILIFVMDMSKKDLIQNAKNMASSAANGIGPDIAIIVSSSAYQADFWQKRLTGADGIHATGSVLKKDAVVISVTESNWQGPAGNALGTLNGCLQAVRRGNELGLMDIPADADIKTLADAFITFSKGKSVFMFHTAGKGTRMAPLPGAEHNSKPKIKLPRMIDVSGEKVPLTILEAVLLEASIYASSRTDRLSVFWGDQIVINELDITLACDCHIELFGELMPLDESIESYGVLIPVPEGGCRQREKLSLEDIRGLLPEGAENVYRSLGYFTVSLDFLEAILKIDDHLEALDKTEGSLNTDPDWWQPLTSERDEYISVMTKKGIPANKAGCRWDSIDALRMVLTGSKMKHFVGFKDIGASSLWLDFGQNKYYLDNMLLLTERSDRGDIARAFFGIEKDKWIDDDSVIEAEVSVKDSVVLGSRITGGRLERCVVVGSDLGETEAISSVIIGSTVPDMKAREAICYNVVDSSVELEQGHVMANIFHPDTGRISMKTEVLRDGSVDWKSGECVCGNEYTYPEIAELMGEIKIEDSAEAKEAEVRRLKAGKDEGIVD